MKNDQAFEFADKIHHFYSSGPGYGEGINMTIAEYLGPEKYKLFCSNMQSVPMKKEVLTPKTFKESYTKDTINDDDIVDDGAVRDQWSIGQIMTEIKKLL